MTITLYKNKSEDNVVDKELSTIDSLVGSLRHQSSIISPSIVIESSADAIVNCNYIHIPEWNRYYFVKNITAIKTNLWLLECQVDVLYTYRAEIWQQSGIIARQEHEYNLYLDDDKFLVNAQRIYWTKSFPNRVPAASSGGSSFILTIAGGE